MKAVDTVTLPSGNNKVQIYLMIWTNYPEHQPIVVFDVLHRDNWLISLNLSIDEARKIAEFLMSNANQAERFYQTTFGEKK